MCDEIHRFQSGGGMPTQELIQNSQLEFNGEFQRTNFAR
jgi:hypothetical protein